MKDDKPHKIDLVPIAIYLICLTVLLVGYHYSLIQQNYLNQLIMGMNITIPMFLYAMYYKRLRINAIFLTWIVLGVVHLISTYSLSKSNDFSSVIGNYASDYLSILLTLTIFFTLRLISAFVFGQEFIVAVWYSPSDIRKKNAIDFILTVLGAGILLFLLIMSK